MPKCHKCGFDNPVESTVCRGCGVELSLSRAQLEAIAEEERKTEQARTREKQLRYLCFVGFLALMGSFVFKSLYRELPTADFLPFVKIEPVSFEVMPLLFLEPKEFEPPVPQYAAPQPRPADPNLSEVIRSLSAKTATAGAETLILKNGKKLVGSIISEDDKFIKFRDAKLGIEWSIPKTDIKERKKE